MTPLATFIADHHDQMLARLETLVNIDSGTYNKPEVDRAARAMAGWLDELGFNAEISPQLERGDHVVARKMGAAGRTILLVGHCDTVFPAGETARRPFRREGQRAFGPGIYDMKGGLTLMLTALAALQATAPLLWDALGVIVVVNGDEEIASPTSRSLIEAAAREADLVCVLEPARANGEYVTQRKGVGTYTLQVTGKAAHAGARPEDGASALHELLRKLNAVLDLPRPPDFTLNVGVVRGGMRPNVVADSAEAEIDVRAPTPADVDWIDAEMRRIAAQPHIPGTATVLGGGVEFPPMPRTATNLALFELVRQAGAELGLTLEHTATGGGSDGNYASQYAPTLDGMGVRGGGAHSADEFIYVDSLVERAQVLARFLELWSA